MNVQDFPPSGCSLQADNDVTLVDMVMWWHWQNSYRGRKREGITDLSVIRMLTALSDRESVKWSKHFELSEFTEVTRGRKTNHSYSRIVYSNITVGNLSQRSHCVVYQSRNLPKLVAMLPLSGTRLTIMWMIALTICSVVSSLPCPVSLR